jgi:hypothetical protein
MTAEAQCRIDKQAAATRVQKTKGFVEQDRLVTKFGFRVLHIERSKGGRTRVPFNSVYQIAEPKMTPRR